MLVMAFGRVRGQFRLEVMNTKPRSTIAGMRITESMLNRMVEILVLHWLLLETSSSITVMQPTGSRTIRTHESLPRLVVTRARLVARATGNLIVYAPGCRIPMEMAFTCSRPQTFRRGIMNSRLPSTKVGTKTMVVAVHPEARTFLSVCQHLGLL